MVCSNRAAIPGFGHLSDEMVATLAPIVKGKVCWDLGCGFGGRAVLLRNLGAAHVVALDKEDIHVKRLRRHVRIETIQCLFRDAPVPDAGIDLAFLSWPMNTRLVGLPSLLSKARIVVYLGSNEGGSSCGDAPLFEHLLRRRLHLSIHDRANSLLIVDDPLPVGVVREPTQEEQAAMAQFQRWPKWTL